MSFRFWVGITGILLGPAEVEVVLSSQRYIYISKSVSVRY